MYQGKKFNSRMEPMDGPDGQYLGIQRYRFYQRCCCCSAEFTFLTDPQNIRYAVEAGAKALSVPHEHDAAVLASARSERAVLERDDPMAALALRAEESMHAALEMDRLDDLRTLRARHERVEVDTLLAAAHGGAAADDQEGHEDKGDGGPSLTAFRDMTRRIDDEPTAASASLAAPKFKPVAAKRGRSSLPVHVKAARRVEAARPGLPGMDVYDDDDDE